MSNKEKMEKELRFVLTGKEYEVFKENVRKNEETFVPGKALLELTVMYDNPNPEYSFYQKSVDGRLRVRTAKPGKADILPASTELPDSLLTWKQRIPEYQGNEVCQEREIEASISAEEMDAVILILEKVLHCPKISSYERNRETLYYDGIEIASDTFPYGHVVELELKSGNESELHELAARLGLNQTMISTKSCDDMYRWLCEKTHRQPQTDILFNDHEMPLLDEVLGDERNGKED